ncbi:MAG TPA: hypothetical protein VF972_10750, partial [Actinomycetota bacterium]
MRLGARLGLVTLAVWALAAGPPLPPLPSPSALPPVPEVQLPTPVPIAPPKPSPSYYMETADPQVTYNLGCDLGRGAQDGTEPSTSVVVLDFGMPVSLGHGTYGTSLFSGPNSTTTTIQHAAEAMARGFWTCTVQTPPDLLDDRAPLTIGVGTSNYGSHVTYGHGRAWGRMVNQANQTLRRQGWSSKVAIVGASDLELSWSSPSVVRAWENGYAAAAGAPLIDFGDAAGCPPA